MSGPIQDSSEGADEKQEPSPPKSKYASIFAMVPIPPPVMGLPIGDHLQMTFSLPAWQKTHPATPARGILVVNGQAYKLVSMGAPDDSEYTAVLAPYPQALQVPGFTVNNIGHVEASAAALLRRLYDEGQLSGDIVLYVNLIPCDKGRDPTTSEGCWHNLDKMLPVGVNVLVYWRGYKKDLTPTNYIESHTFQGSGE